jgi:hypothetical protein
MWNQVNCSKNHYANIGTSSPYKQWSYPMVSCPHQVAPYCALLNYTKRFQLHNSRDKEGNKENKKDYTKLSSHKSIKASWVFLALSLTQANSLLKTNLQD